MQRSYDPLIHRIYTDFAEFYYDDSEPFVKLCNATNLAFATYQVLKTMGEISCPLFKIPKPIEHGSTIMVLGRLGAQYSHYEQILNLL